MSRLAVDQRRTVKRYILNMACDCWFPCSCVYPSLVKARKIVWESQIIDSSSITQSQALWVWRCDVTTSNSIQDGGALVVNILVFDLRVQPQYCTYQRKTLLFTLIKVTTFICKREISGCSSPLTHLLSLAYLIATTLSAWMPWTKSLGHPRTFSIFYLWPEPCLIAECCAMQQPLWPFQM